ncbi:hypothetical protein QBC35DRAFT_389016, partial [Podospora australis]
ICTQLVHRYSSCRCLYYQNAIQRCSEYGKAGHPIQQRTTLVGYACSEHSSSTYFGPSEAATAGGGEKGPSMGFFLKYCDRTLSTCCGKYAKAGSTA